MLFQRKQPAVLDTGECRGLTPPSVTYCTTARRSINKRPGSHGRTATLIEIGPHFNRPKRWRANKLRFPFVPPLPPYRWETAAHRVTGANTAALIEICLALLAFANRFLTSFTEERQEHEVTRGACQSSEAPWAGRHDDAKCSQAKLYAADQRRSRSVCRHGLPPKLPGGRRRTIRLLGLGVQPISSWRADGSSTQRIFVPVYLSPS